MNDFAIDLLMSLLRTTLFLSLSVIFFLFVARFARLRSARWQQLLAVVALTQGIVWVRIPLTIPWFQISDETVVAADQPMLDDVLSTIEIPTLASPPPAETQTVRPNPEVRGSGDAFVNSVTGDHVWQWPLLIAGLWVAGLIVIPAVGAVRYVRFLRRIPIRREVEPSWLDEWRDVREAMKVRGPVEFRLTDRLGPLLCWTPKGSLLLTPENVWRELRREQRLAVLRHELAHYQRGDLLKSLAVRLLALPHWFNPLVWLAVRRFDEAAEWLCDDVARQHCPATDYARALVRLCELPFAHGFPTTAAGGRGVAHRIRRLLDSQIKEDSTMKKLILAAAAIALLAVGIGRVELVAQSASQGGSAEKQNDSANTERAAKRKAMIEAATKTYEAIQGGYAAGTEQAADLYAWSSYIRLAEIRASDSKQQVIKACQEHRDRMQRLHAKVNALYQESARGGEESKYRASEFYVAEAELLLLEAKGN